jgi:TonB-dependent receptor
MGMACTMSVSAQIAATGVVEGRVLNAANESYLGNVRVTIEGTELQALTDESGAYRLRGVPAGEVRIRASYVGMVEQVEGVRVLAEKTARLDFTLTRPAGMKLGQQATPGEPVVVLDPVAVVEEREMSAQFLAMNEQRNAPNLKHVVAFDEYGYTTDGNLGEFLKHIPGVAVDFSASIPVGVSIRGFPSSSTAISSDGNLLAAGETVAVSRSTSLSNVATDNISRIEVTKVPTPDMPATGLGGSINIISNSAFTSKKPLFRYTVYSTFRGDYPFELKGRSVGIPIEGLGDAQSSGHILPSFDFTYLKPVNSSLAISLAGSQILRYIHNDTFFPTWRVADAVQTQSRYRVVPQVATIRSGQVKIDYMLGERVRIGGTLQRRERRATQSLGDLLLTYGAGVTGDRSTVTGAGTGVGTVQMASGFIQRNNANTSASLKVNYDGTNYKVDAGASYSSTDVDNYDTPNGYFGVVNASIANVVIRGQGITSDPDEAGSHVPASVTVTDRSGNALNIGDGRQYSIASVNTTDLRFKNTRQGVNLNVQRDFGAAGLTALKVGASYTEEKQQTRNQGRTFNFRTGQSVAVRMAGNYGVVDPALFNYLPALVGRKIDRISPMLVYDLARTNPDYFVEDQALSHRTRVSNAFRLTETITSSYIRADFRLADNRLNVVTGVRYERTADEGRGPRVNPSAQYVRDANGNRVLTPGGAPILITTVALDRDRLVYQELGTSASSSYDGLYPSLNASYRIFDRLVARAAYARTIGRPDLPVIMPGATLSENPDTTGVRTITVVNTGLKPWTADSFDLSLETHLFKNGFGSVGVFQKDIADFFGTSRRPATPAETSEYGVAPNEGYDIITRENAGDARIKGFELGYRQSLAFLPNWARGIQTFINYTELNLDGTATADFTGFNPRTLSWGVSLVRPRFSVKFNMAHQGETRRTPSGAAGNFLWAGAKRRDTLSAEFQITKHVSLFGQVLDLLNGGFIDVQKSYTPALNTPDYARYQRVISTGTELTLGLKGRF